MRNAELLSLKTDKSAIMVIYNDALECNIGNNNIEIMLSILYIL